MEVNIQLDTFLNNNNVSRINDNANTTIMDVTKKNFGNIARTAGKKHAFRS